MTKAKEISGQDLIRYVVAGLIDDGIANASGPKSTEVFSEFALRAGRSAAREVAKFWAVDGLTCVTDRPLRRLFRAITDGIDAGKVSEDIAIELLKAFTFTPLCDMVLLSGISSKELR